MDEVEKIRLLRLEHGWSEAELARRAKLGKATINNLKRNSYQPTLPTLKAVCGAFGITLSQFFADANLPLDLTPGQRELLEAYNALTEPRQRALVQLARVMR